MWIFQIFSLKPCYFFVFCKKYYESLRFYDFHCILSRSMVYFKPVRDDAGPAVPAMKQYSGPSPVLKAISYTLLLFLIHSVFSNHLFLLSCIFFSTFIWKTCFSGEKILLVKCHIMWENEHRYAVIILTKATCLTKRTCLFFADTTNHTSIFERSFNTWFIHRK